MKSLGYRLLRIRRRIERRRNIRIYRELRTKAEPFNLADAAFKKMFRLTKQATRDIIEKLRPFSRPSCIPFEIQVFTALHFFAQGSYQATIGRNHLLGLSQPSVCRSIRNVTNLIVNHLAPSSIKFPQSQTEKAEAQQGYISDIYDYSQDLYTMLRYGV